MYFSVIFLYFNDVQHLEVAVSMYLHANFNSAVLIYAVYKHSLPKQTEDSSLTMMLCSQTSHFYTVLIIS